MSLETALWLTPCLQVFPSAALVAVSEFCFVIVDKPKDFYGLKSLEMSYIIL